jgi:hypothetical protein
LTAAQQGQWLLGFRWRSLEAHAPVLCSAVSEYGFKYVAVKGRTNLRGACGSIDQQVLTRIFDALRIVISLSKEIGLKSISKLPGRLWQAVEQL